MISREEFEALSPEDQMWAVLDEIHDLVRRVTAAVARLEQLDASGG